MTTIREISSNYGISKEEILSYLKTNPTDDIPEDKVLLSTQVQDLLQYIEQRDDRIKNALQEPTFATTYGEKGHFIKVFQNDALSFLRKIPSNSVDLIVTDPAYSGMNNKLKLGSGRIVGVYNDKGKQNGKWFGEFEDSAENYHLFLSEARRILKRSTGHIYIMFDSFSLLSLGPIVRAYFDVKNVLTWDKINIGMGHYFRRRHEFIIFATNGNTRKLRTRQIPDVWRFKRIHHAKYPTQKPVEVFQTMLYASAEKDFVVCDPFLGSGSSAIAAIQHHCHFIGCDIADKAIALSSSRISTYIQEGVDELQSRSANVD